MSVHRSFLFVPGNNPRRVEKALAAGADAVILDLEDAVPVAEKVATRGAVVAALGHPRDCLGYLRVNALGTEWCYADLLAAVAPGVDGIVLPKVETPEGLYAIDWLIGELERSRGLPHRAIDLIPIVETGKGLAALPTVLAAGTRVKRVAFGAADFTLDMNMVWTRDETELAAARAAVVLASRVAGIEPPIDTVWARLKDGEGYRASVETSRRVGFQGRLCIHPDQLAVVHEVFTPSDEAYARAQRIVTAFRDAEAAGSASIQVDGQFVDYPIVEQARRTVAMVERIRARRAA